MNNDKELVDKCWEEYTSKFDLFGNEWHDMGLDEIFKAGFEAAKRSQPSVMLTKRIYNYPMHARKEIQDSLTTAGIKYTIGE